MSRHRNIRGQNFDEDYEGYDDVYGHSVEEDYMYGASPATAEQFLYRRDRHELSHYLEDIGEDDRNSDSEQPLADSRNYERPKLNDVDEARLQSCLDEIRNVVGDTTPEHVLIDAVIANKFDYERALDAILNKQENQHKTGIHTRPDPTLVNPNSPISQDAFKLIDLGGGGRDSNAQRLKVKGPREMKSHGGQENVSSFSNASVANPSGTGKFQSYYDKVAADKDLVRLNIGSKNPLPEGKGSSGCGSGRNREGAMQFYPKDMGFKPQGHMQDHMQSQMPGQLPGQMSGQMSGQKQVKMQGQPLMSAGGLSLAELSQMQQIKTNAALGKPLGHVAPADLKPSTGLSHLMSSHPSGSDVRNPLKSTGIEVVGNKSRILSLADLASGQTQISVKNKSSMPSNVSLGALASSQLSSSRFPCQKPLSAPENTTQANLSLADLASGHLPMASTIPQMNKQGQTSGLKSTLSGNASLSDLASSHLSSSPTYSLQSNRQGGMKAPGIKSTSAGGLSLSDLASSHLSSSPKQSLMNSKKIGMKAAGIKSTSSGGVSLADLASSHLSSSPDTSALGSLSENLRGTGGKSVRSSGVSLSELASADLSSPKDASSVGLKIAKKNEKQSDPFRGSKLSSCSSSKQHLKQTYIIGTSASHPETLEAKADQIGTLDLGMSHHLCGSDNSGGMKPSEGVQRPRVPPGFESFIQPPRHSTSLQHDDTFQPRSHVSGTHSRNNRQAKSSGKSNKKLLAKHTSLKSSTHSTSSTDSSTLSAPVSTFGNALCHQCRTTSATAAKIARGRVGYHGVQRRVLHRHFSFERQKSRQEELKEESWRDIRPFDFSTPSPDDIVKERQKGAFVPLNQSKGFCCETN